MICSALAIVVASVVGGASVELDDVARRVVKLYGAAAGRIQGYGSAVVVSPDGHLLTTRSAMLSDDSLAAVFSDGRRLPARVVGTDPALDLALLKVDRPDSPCFMLDAKGVERGARVFALSNMFGIAAGAEQVSVQRGIIAGVTPSGSDEKRYLLDLITTNPGAAGGALVDHAGRLVGILAKEKRDPETSVWIHSAIPIDAAATFARLGIEGKLPAATPSAPTRKASNEPVELRGLRLLPDVLDKTPAYVDGVEPDSLAAKAGLRADDLIVSVGDDSVADRAELLDRLRGLGPAPWRLMVLRGEKLLPVDVPATMTKGASP